MATIYLVAKMVGSLVMGRLADRFGAMIVLRVSCICGAVAALLAAFIKDYRLAYVMYALLAVAVNGIMMSSSIACVTCSKNVRTPIYMATVGLLCAPLYVITSFCGAALASWFSYTALFLLAVGVYAVSALLTFWLKDKHRIAKNAPVISTIGVALAMVRDMVERTVTNPTDDDIISVRREAELKAIQNGAAPGTVEVSVEVDTQRNIIRAIAVGATEMRSKDMMNQKLGKDALFAIVAENLGADKAQLRIVAENGPMFAVQYDKVEKKLFGLRKKTTHPLRLIDEEGVIRLQKNNAWVRQSSVAEWEKDAAWMLEELTEYNDGGANLPNLYVVLGKRVIDLSGLSSDTQIYSLGNVELAGCGAQEPLIVAATKRVDA